MDAPLYPPSTAFVQPQRIPTTFSSHHSSLAELRANSAAWKIVLSELPEMAGLAASPLMQSMGTAISLRMIADFGDASSEAVDRIDARFAALAPSL